MHCGVNIGDEGIETQDCGRCGVGTNANLEQSCVVGSFGFDLVSNELFKFIAGEIVWELMHLAELRGFAVDHFL
jgi:hypothetical protein